MNSSFQMNSKNVALFKAPSEDLQEENVTSLNNKQLPCRKRMSLV